jgi:hypothetical protein
MVYGGLVVHAFKQVFADCDNSTYGIAMATNIFRHGMHYQINPNINMRLPKRRRNGRITRQQRTALACNRRNRRKIGQATNGIDRAFGMNKPRIWAHGVRHDGKIRHINGTNFDPQSRQGLARKFGDTCLGSGPIN